MAKESKLICKSIFKNSNNAKLKSEFNEKMSGLIRRSENLLFFIPADRNSKK